MRINSWWWDFSIWNFSKVHIWLHAIEWRTSARRIDASKYKNKIFVYSTNWKCNAAPPMAWYVIHLIGESCGPCCSTFLNVNCLYAFYNESDLARYFRRCPCYCCCIGWWCVAYALRFRSTFIIPANRIYILSSNSIGVSYTVANEETHGTLFYASVALTLCTINFYHYFLLFPGKPNIMCSARPDNG